MDIEEFKNTKGEDMLQKLWTIFDRYDRATIMSQEKSMCLVNIQLAGKMHIFYQDISFQDSLIDAIEMSPASRFLEIKTCNGSFTINLDCINFVDISEDVYKIKNDDLPGYTVFLTVGEEPIVIGELPLEQVYVNCADQEIQFIRLGSYYFNRDQVALIVLNERKSS